MAQKIVDHDLSRLSDEEFIRWARTGELPRPKTVADLSDPDFYEQYRRQLTRSSREEAEARRGRVEAADLAATEQTTDMSDGEMLRAYREVLDGTIARRKAIRSAQETYEDRLEYSLFQWRGGSPINRDDEEDLRERGLIGQ
jgi:hypothetical protein